ncbi:MAG: hypothetical protein H0A75_08420 [Candidatus Methanofishera endochildressiae]|uniref:Uncharacterized protein n=1 Tax=Candidatus Methanofishera endochildressiae TaxID=2738884 RepID=A0A7Z0MPL8_9GAMM|nr:hypothetical protein [Candidatus Methanofishera endochildressiae]
MVNLSASAGGLVVLGCVIYAVVSISTSAGGLIVLGCVIYPVIRYFYLCWWTSGLRMSSTY